MRSSTLALPTVFKVSVKAAAATNAACSRVNGGHNRVLTWPATGALAITMTCTGMGRMTQWMSVASSQKSRHVTHGPCGAS